MSITNANIEFNENGTPFATEFADIYFSDSQGLDETNYVFLLHNAIPLRWDDWQSDYFTIAETGFGTGLNFLATVALFDKYLTAEPDKKFHLHFISIEKFPIKQDDLARALQAYPELQAYTDELLKHYPQPISGCHRLHLLNNRVTLDLWLGDVHQVLPQIENKPHGIIDAWFLDGFAPSKNPEMWTQSLFDHMARLAKHNCTLATFTAAGHVRRGLIAAGFDLQKRPGHGRKREMLAGAIKKPTPNPCRLPYFQRQPYQSSNNNSPKEAIKVAIIGGGLAAANCAYALAQKGLQATVYCQESALAQGASGNPQGGFYPQLNAEAGVSSQIHAAGFSYAARIYKQLLADGFDYSHDWCGTLLVAFNDNVTRRYQKMIDNKTWPHSFIHWLTAEQSSEKANINIPYPGLFVPNAGWINPPELVHALIKAAKSKVVTEHQLIDLSKDNELWKIHWKNGHSDTADIVIFATGSESVDIAQLAKLPFRLVRGQVEAIDTNHSLNDLNTVLCHKGYFTPAWQGKHAMGSTYIKEDRNCDYRVSEQTLNLAMHQKALSQCDWIHTITPQNTGRAAIRASTPDHLPMVGAVPNIEQQKIHYQDLYKALPAKHYPALVDHSNLYVLSGLGSRGLSTAPLCAEILASQIVDQSFPLAHQLLDALNPNRFLIRGLIRREY